MALLLVRSVMKRTRALGLCFLAGMLAMSFGGVRLAWAMCAAPELEVEPKVARAGDPVTITGRFFAATCNDQGEAGGCFGADKPARNKPANGIEVQVLQDGRASTLATVDADTDFRIQVTVALPATLHPGPAIVKANAEVPIEVR